MKIMRAHAKGRKLGVRLTSAVVAGLPGEARAGTPRVKASLSADGDHAPFPLQQLLGIARQSGIAEPLPCATSLNFLTTSRLLRCGLLRMLKPLGLSESRFFALVTLYALDPIPTSSADLAYHTEVTRPAMTGILDAMEKRGWIHRERRLKTDRRFGRVSLTDEGRETTAFAIYRFLKSAAEISSDFSLTQHKLFEKLCARLRRRSLNPAP